MKTSVEAICEKLQKNIEALRAPEGYLNAGYPNYHDLFGRDSLISAWQMLPIDPRIARDTLLALARRQATQKIRRREAEPGKILHEYRLDKARQKELPFWGWPYYGSVDSTSWFIILAGLYCRHTNDLSLLHNLWPHIRRAMQWHLLFGDKDRDGFIEYKKQNPRGLFHQGWKDSFEDHLGITPPVAIVEVQGYYYAAMREYSWLAKTLKRDVALGTTLAQKAADLKTKFHRAFWMPQEKFYALGLDATKQRRRAVTSNPGHLLFCGMLPQYRAQAVVRRLFKKDMWTRFGIRTLSDKDPDFDPASYHLGSVWPHDNWIIYQGLLRCGFRKEARRLKTALVHTYRTLGCIPELFGVIRAPDGKERAVLLGKETTNAFSANRLQAWAVAGLLNMLSERLP